MRGATVVEPAQAAIPTVQPVDAFDLTDLLTDAAKPTSQLITVAVNPDGTVSFALPRAEVGQGITTAVAMTIADEMDIPLDKVNVTLADARPELVWNQLTGGSNSMHSIFTPVRVAAALAKGQLLTAAAAELGGDVAELSDLERSDHSAGRQDRDGGLAHAQGRGGEDDDRDRDAQARVAVQAGRHPAAPDRRARHRHRAQTVRDGPRCSGRAADDGVPSADDQRERRSVNNQAQVEAMPGVTDVAIIPHTAFVPGGVAVRAQTFGQCIDAVRALE